MASELSSNSHNLPNWKVTFEETADKFQFVRYGAVFDGLALNTVFVCDQLELIEFEN